jgi:transposase InsO family protein
MMQADILVAAIEDAVACRGAGAGCALHTDRRSHIRSATVQGPTRPYAIVGSMGRGESVADNAAIELFW